MHYYRIPHSTPTYKHLRKFDHEARKAALDADRYAHRWGAISYVQSFAFFDGGVEFLEFDHTPDPLQWRKATHEWDAANNRFIDEYEPNVMYRSGEQPTDGEHWPSSTWCRVYASHPRRNGDDKLPSTARYIEYYGTADQYSSDGRPLPQLRRAIRSEIERVRLSVVRVETLYAIMGVALKQQPGSSPVVETVTPTLFQHGGDYYVSIDGQSSDASLEAITEGRFRFLMGRAQSR